MNSDNGEAHAERAPVDLRERVVFETEDGAKHEYEIVGLVEDDQGTGFAVAYGEKDDEFVVTDAHGNLLDDEALAQEILDDFFVLAEESAEGE